MRPCFALLQAKSRIPAAWNQMVWGQRGRLRSLGSAQTVDVEAEQRSARLRTGTGRTLRRAPGRRLGAGDPIEGLFLLTAFFINVAPKP